MTNLLITFGCSWTWGVGIFYEDGMSSKEYFDHPVVYKPEGTFRQILSEKWKCKNLNFSTGASSNQKQFRYAKHFFASDEFLKLKKEYKNITVLWGITSTARNEIWDFKNKDLQNLIFTNPGNNQYTFTVKEWTRYFYNHENEVFTLAKDMNFFNSYFESLGIKNYWFDTFNHHDYSKEHPALKFQATNEKHQNEDNWHKLENDVILNEIKLKSLKSSNNIKNMLFDNQQPRDLCSLLCKEYNIDYIDNNYHTSSFSEDSNRIKFLVNNNILNPHSYHPTKLGHQTIANLIHKEINTL